jgi:hypothetical protein
VDLLRIVVKEWNVQYDNNADLENYEYFIGKVNTILEKAETPYALVSYGQTVKIVKLK